METIAMNNLWQYIQNLPLTEQNRQWLADKLMNDKPRPKGENRKMFQERLEMLGELKEDWDDEGALPISKEVVGHVRVLLDSLNDELLDGWNLFPAINGTLTFQHASLDAILSIGEEDYSFVYSDKGVVLECIDSSPYSKEAIMKIFVKLKGIAK